MLTDLTMRGVCALPVLALWIGIVAADPSIFSGFLGCRFSETVCQQNEECVDDRLFGTCQSIYRPRDPYQYSLNSRQLRSLEGEIRRLVQSQYTWSDLYTQCVLSNVLLAYRSRQSEYNPSFCGEGDNGSAVNLLKSYLEAYYETAAKNRIQKKAEDEIVQVHKYLKSHKRQDPSDALYDYGDPSETPRDYESNDITADYENMYDGNTGLSFSSLTPEKLAMLEEYLGPLTSDNDYDQTEGDVLAPADGFLEQDTPLDLESADERLFTVPADDDQLMMTSMDQDDAQLLDDLLQGKTKVSSLSDNKIARLTQYVDSMLSTMKDASAPGGDITEDTDPAAVTLPSLDQPPLTGAVSDVSSDSGDTLGRHIAVKKEQLNSDLLDDAAGDEAPVTKSNRDNHHHDNHFDDSMKPVATSKPKYGLVDVDSVYLKFSPSMPSKDDAVLLLVDLERHLGVPDDSFSDSEFHMDDNEINFHVDEDKVGMNASTVARLAKFYAKDIQNETSYLIYDAGIGTYDSQVPVGSPEPEYFVVTFILCGLIAGIVLAVITIYIVRRHLQSKEKLAQLSGGAEGVEASNDYQDLCRQRMQSKSSEKPEPLHVASRVGSVSATEKDVRSPSSRSSTSSWSEEPVTSNMDISTGHIVLSYMEDHLKNKDRLEREWDALCAYEAEPNSITMATDTTSMRKNRYGDVLPYDHSRVVLTAATNVSGSDYINASTITDHDPRNPAYIATQGPLPHTVADFWQMIWEQGSVVIVNLTKLTETGQAMCHRYWPEEGSDLYHIYEVHLVSEHIWCDDYLVRSFYLKNLQTNETRTVTQFHFLTWHDLGIPGSAKALLDFRRKVNKSYRGRSCPIVVHCSDGSGRTGTYTLIDMVLNRMSKGAKEIDIAATLEHIRDQRMLMAKTKEQFEFALASVAEEVHAILKALPQ